MNATRSSQRLSQLWRFLNEREQIRRHGRGATSDGVLLRWHFCNVYREADPGTIALRSNVSAALLDSPETLFATVWYRCLNRVEHAPKIGVDIDGLLEYLLDKQVADEPIFTKAHVVSGSITAHEALYSDVWVRRQELAEAFCRTPSIEYCFTRLQEFKLIGPFLAYEIATDLSRSSLQNASDVHTWAYVGEAATRALYRLGLEERHLPELYQVATHDENTFDLAFDYSMHLSDFVRGLCEFDRYCRALETGRLKRKYKAS